MGELYERELEVLEDGSVSKGPDAQSEDLSSNPWLPCKKQGTAANTCDASTGAEMGLFEAQ